MILTVMDSAWFAAAILGWLLILLTIPPRKPGRPPADPAVIRRLQDELAIPLADLVAQAERKAIADSSPVLRDAHGSLSLPSRDELQIVASAPVCPDVCAEVTLTNVTHWDGAPITCGGGGGSGGGYSNRAVQ